MYPDKITYGPIDKLILMGGSFVMASLLEALKNDPIPVVVFAAPRHLEGVVTEKGETLREVLARQKTRYFESEDINTDARLKAEISEQSLGIAIGAAWTFEKATVGLFSTGYLLDFMGIDLPRYRGGAHYTWQILHKNKKGAAHLQIILGGKETFHRGPVILSKTHSIPRSAKIPKDYFAFLSRKEADVLASFVASVRNKKTFAVRKLDERQSSVYPFLSTIHQGFIDWSWTGEAIARFIDAFGEPYKGASTFYNKERVHLLGVEVLRAEEEYHPFTAGILIRKDAEGIYVAAQGALLRIARVQNEKGEDIISAMKAGERLYTPHRVLDEAMEFTADYQPRGLSK